MVLLTSLLYGLLAILDLKGQIDSPTTELSGKESCRVLNVTNGRVSCSNNGRQTVCQVFCNGKDYGQFTCSKNMGWSKLPKCATPIRGEAQNIPLDGGCPDGVKCNQACREDPRFRTRGSCVGSDRAVCSCEPPHHVTEQPEDAEAMGCTDDICTAMCVPKFYFYGKCENGVCQCKYF